MSASLVGSEMCIRDRFECVRPCNNLVVGVQRCARDLPIDAAAINARLVPVSYTHLTLPTICSV
eukprot:5504828-Alexandrium_andersonii.AAC.1